MSNSTPLKNLCSLFIDGDWIESKDQSESGIRLVQTGNIGKGIFIEKEERARYVSKETFSRLKCSEIKQGDILISRLPDPIGRACILPAGLGMAIAAVDCSIVRLKDSMFPNFFIAFTQSDNYKHQILRYITGTTRQRISRKNLGTITIPTPSLTKQKNIAKIFTKIELLIQYRRSQLNKLTNVIKSQFNWGRG